MLILYQLVLFFYVRLVWVSSFFNKKANLFLKGRKDQQIRLKSLALLSESRVWFHFSSLGEFEQGRPLIESWKKDYPDDKIIITFFSPSGYEIRKNYPIADAVFYLPVDGRKSSLKFIKQLNPRLAVFTKYDFWYYYFFYLQQLEIPLYMISVKFRTDQIFFKWYGRLFKRMLAWVTWFFVQDELSMTLLHSTGNKRVSIAGDTRFDRVIENYEHRQALPEILSFTDGSLIFIAGSTWPADEKLLLKLLGDPRFNSWKFIIAPHEPDLKQIQTIIQSSPVEVILHSTLKKKFIQPGIPDYQDKNLFPDLNSKTQVSNPRLLVIDNIGMLSSIYQFGDLAYIGGGFGSGIHNILEAGVVGIPVIFGPEFKKFKEAVDTLRLGCSFSVSTYNELVTLFELFQNTNERKLAGSKISAYIRENKGATSFILTRLHSDLKPTD